MFIMLIYTGKKPGDRLFCGTSEFLHQAKGNVADAVLRTYIVQYCLPKVCGHFSVGQCSMVISITGEVFVVNQGLQFVIWRIGVDATGS